MSIFQIVQSGERIPLGPEWVDSASFKHKIVDEHGKKVGADYSGRKYEVIGKKERDFSWWELLLRRVKGVAFTVFSLGFVFIFNRKEALKLFTREKEVIRFGQLVGQTESARSEEIATKPYGYESPKLLLQDTELAPNQFLNFALVEKSGKKQLVPVVYSNQFSQRVPCKEYEGSPMEALLRIVQDKKQRLSWISSRHFGPPINYILTHPDNVCIKAEDFFALLQERDETGTPRIQTLNAGSTRELLQLAQEGKVHIDFQAKTAQGNDLFTTWAGQGNQEITRLLLELHSEFAVQAPQPFVRAALQGHKEVELLLAAIEKYGIELSPDEIWIKRAVKNDCAFADEEFTSLDQDMQKQVYFVANAFTNYALVDRLKALGMAEEPRFSNGPYLFAYNMDVVSVKKRVNDFLISLRQAGQLMTQDEFNKLNRREYISKGEQIGRILGTDFIKKIIAENGLRHIKVPKKIAVIKNVGENISFSLSRGLEPLVDGDHVEIFAERIHEVERKLSLEEALEFMIVLEETGFNDFLGHNFIFSEDGIYFIDTEFTNFSPSSPCFGSIETIKNLLNPQDVEPFMREFTQRKKQFEREKPEREANIQKNYIFLMQPCRNLASGYQFKEMSISIRQIISSVVA